MFMKKAILYFDCETVLTYNDKIKAIKEYGYYFNSERPAILILMRDKQFEIHSKNISSPIRVKNIVDVLNFVQSFVN